MELENKAHNVESAGDYLSAIEYYLLTLSAFKLENLTEEMQFRTGKILNKIADLYTEVGDFDHAIKYYNDAIKQYLAGKENLTEIYRYVSICHINLGMWFLTKSKYPLALNHFKKAFEFTERFIKADDSPLRQNAIQYNILTLVISSLCLFNDNGDLQHIKQHLKKAAKLIEEFNVTGIISDLTHFLLCIINGEADEAFLILKEKILGAVFSNIVSPVLETVIIGLAIELAVKYIPSLKNAIIDKFLDGEGEVLLTQKCFEDMLLYGLVFASRRMPPPYYKEVLALMVGKIENSNVIITEIVPITSGTETDVQFKEEHYAKAAEINAIAADRNEFIIGWYHTHPGLGLFLSPVDIINQLGYQSLNEKAIAIVFDFTQITPSRSGFTIFRLNEASMAASYHAVQWQITNSPKTSYLETISILNRLVVNLNHIVLKNQKMSLSELAKQLDRSELLLEQIIPKLVELELLPKIQYNPETKIVSKKE
jgi:proteasome lid subunit RPN8/RPN11